MSTILLPPTRWRTTLQVFGEKLAASTDQVLDTLADTCRHLTMVSIPTARGRPWPASRFVKCLPVQLLFCIPTALHGHRGAFETMQGHGSSFAIVYINQRTVKMCMACCGGANAVLGELVHGLAAQVHESLPHNCQELSVSKLKAFACLSTHQPGHLQSLCGPSSLTLNSCAGGGGQSPVSSDRRS